MVKECETTHNRGGHPTTLPPDRGIYKDTDKTPITSTKDPTQRLRYLLTGKDRAGRCFRITTNTPQHYNIYQGSLWMLIEGKRKLIKRIYN